MTKLFLRAALALVGVVLLITGIIVFTPPRAFSRAADQMSEADLLEGYRHVEVASVSDAIEKLTGRRMYLSHRMHPIFTSKFAGLAVTVKLKKEENKDPNALSGMLAAIDQGGPNSVYVMVVEDGADGHRHAGA
jgi:regulator of RNase E activity RraA